MFSFYSNRSFRKGNIRKFVYLIGEDYPWGISADCKVIAIILAMQKGYTKFYIFGTVVKDKAMTCKSSIANRIYARKENLLHQPLVENKNTIIPLHVKFGLVKFF